MSKAFDFVTLGETMLRLSTPHYQRLAQATSLDVEIGGTESNVAVALSRLGFRTSWLSRLPDNGLGQRVIAELNSHGVDTSGVRLAPHERLGTYFIELAVPPRPNRVIYDRANSAVSHMTTRDADFNLIESARWFHMTGITPALSDSCRQVTTDALRFAREFARERGVTTSFDVNYRALLWSAEEAGRTLEPMIRGLDVIFGAHRDALALFGASDDAEAAARELRRRFECKTLVLTLGESGAIVCAETSGVSETPEVLMHVPQTHHVPQIVDRIGAGDAFDAGFIAARLWGKSVEEAVRYGNAMSALKITIPGDLALVTRDEVEQLIAGARDASVR